MSSSDETYHEGLTPGQKLDRLWVGQERLCRNVAALQIAVIGNGNPEGSLVWRMAVADTRLAKIEGERTRALKVAAGILAVALGLLVTDVYQWAKRHWAADPQPIVRKP